MPKLKTIHIVYALAILLGITVAFGSSFASRYRDAQRHLRTTTNDLRVATSSVEAIKLRTDRLENSITEEREIVTQLREENNKLTALAGRLREESDQLRRLAGETAKLRNSITERGAKLTEYNQQSITLNKRAKEIIKNLQNEMATDR